MFANTPEIAAPRRIFSGRRSRASHYGLRVAVALRFAVAMTAICAAGYALASVVNF